MFAVEALSQATRASFFSRFTKLLGAIQSFTVDNSAAVWTALDTALDRHGSLLNKDSHDLLRMAVYVSKNKNRGVRIVDLSNVEA
jgi:hypothetical protein